MKKLHEVGKIVAQIKSYRQRLWLKLKKKRVSARKDRDPFFGVSSMKIKESGVQPFLLTNPRCDVVEYRGNTRRSEV